jgi:hypothetical protein
MSFDIFMAPYKDKEEAPFSRSLLREAFGADAGIGEGPIDSISYSASDGAQVYGAEDETITGLSFNHFGGQRFIQGLLKLADLTQSVIFWPSEEMVGVITREEIRDQIDPEFLEGFSEIRVVHTVQELEDLISAG